MFSHNHATYAGGAIYIRSDAISIGSKRCFYQFYATNQSIFDPRELNVQITFENNTAKYAGSALYGGDVNFCYLIPAMVTTINYFDSIFSMWKIQVMIPVLDNFGKGILSEFNWYWGICNACRQKSPTRNCMT